MLVMPYCQCGSVYTLLEQPQNGLGFEEKEFLRFLNDISKFAGPVGCILLNITSSHLASRATISISQVNCCFLNK